MSDKSQEKELIKLELKQTYPNLPEEEINKLYSTVVSRRMCEMNHETVVRVPTTSSRRNNIKLVFKDLPDIPFNSTPDFDLVDFVAVTLKPYPQELEVFNLVLSEYTVNEVSEQLKCTIQNVYNILNSAKEILAQKWSQLC